jgi:large subunit ribosomal protein L9
MKSLKLILKQDVAGLGKKGDTVDVAEGHGRNYLIPRGLAVLASDGALKEVGLVHDAKAKKEARQLQGARELAAKMKGMTVTVRGKTGDGSKLYGAITNSQIAQELHRAIGQPVDKRKIELTEPIKSLGSYPVQVRLYPGVQAEITIEVVPEV